MGKGVVSRGLFALSAAALLAVLPGTADAAARGVQEPEAIDVFPGKPDAIQRAIDRAHNGDSLYIHAGHSRHYNETPVVDKRLALIGYRGIPVIDGQCGDNVTLDVRHKGVLLHRLKVTGAAAGPGLGKAINLIGINRAKVHVVEVKQTCRGENRAAYGINVFDSGPLRITDNVIRGGFGDAGIYVGGINDTLGGTLTLADNISTGNNRGIIVEDSFNAAAQIKVVENFARENTRTGEGAPTGIFIHNSDNGFYKKNNTNMNGDYGIQVDAQSDDNIIKHNKSLGNGLFDFFNEGADNCGGASNQFGTTSGNPLVHC